MTEPDYEIGFDSLKLLSDKTLFVFALDLEAAEEFHHVNKLVVGVGKVNAAYELTKAIYQRKPKLIVNLARQEVMFSKEEKLFAAPNFYNGIWM